MKMICFVLLCVMLCALGVRAEDLSATQKGVLRRLTLDVEAARKAVDAASISDAEAAALRGRLDAVDTTTPPVVDEKSFRAIFPLNERHAEVFSVYAALNRAKGAPEFVVWKKHRYDPIAATEVPVGAQSPVLGVEMLSGEYRADSLILSNESDSERVVKVSIAGMPGSPAPSWLRVYEVAWTDIMAYPMQADPIPVPSGLIEAVYADGAYSVRVPSGMTKRLWFEVDSSKLAPGEYKGSVQVDSVSVPFSVRVSALAMKKPRLHMGMWDYSEIDFQGFTPENLKAGIEMMRSHFVDTPWSRSGVLPWPVEADFDAQNRLVRPLDFSRFDRWVKELWPGAERYFICGFDVPTQWAGTTLGTPEYDARVGAWISAVEEHVRSLGIDPARIGMLIWDEYRDEVMDNLVIDKAKALKSSGTKMKIFEDPLWRNPQINANRKALTAADILSPNLQIFSEDSEASRQFYLSLHTKNRELWFYQCTGPSKVFDPHKYYRLNAWYAFRYGVKGVGFWSFPDNRDTPSAWNEYMASAYTFSPVFMDETSVSDSVHWQACREGMEDAEYFAMLSDAAAASKDAKVKAEARKVLGELVKWTPGQLAPYVWEKTNEDRAGADAYRLRVMHLLEKMSR